MATNWEGIGSKSYTLPGIEGGELTISETDDRLAIRVSITVKPGTLSVLLTAAQFHALSRPVAFARQPVAAAVRGMPSSP